MSTARNCFRLIVLFASMAAGLIGCAPRLSPESRKVVESVSKDSNLPANRLVPVARDVLRQRKENHEDFDLVMVFPSEQSFTVNNSLVTINVEGVGFVFQNSKNNKEVLTVIVKRKGEVQLVPGNSDSHLVPIPEEWSINYDEAVGIIRKDNMYLSRNYGLRTYILKEKDKNGSDVAMPLWKMDAADKVQLGFAGSSLGVIEDGSKKKYYISAIDGSVYTPDDIVGYAFTTLP